MERILIDKKQKKSPVKPMNAANNLPHYCIDRYDAYMRKLRTPYIRTHDARFMNSHLVDIPALFPDFSADENDPASYDFAFTDVYLKKMVDNGSEPFFRLGVTIENYVHIKRYDIFPPEDPEKWARICEHIIRHYNEGWANGFHFGITYWEIWNEPENCGIGPKNQMWTGTFEEYLSLYEVTAKYLKKCYPAIKVGGYASCGFYALIDAMRTTPEETATLDFYVKCADDFFAFVTSKEHSCPLDFFSWHSYQKVEDTVFMAKYVREKLDAAGLSGVESILNEWNPDISVRGKREDASNTCAMMTSLQDAGADMLMYYDFRLNTSYNGLISPVSHRPFPLYSTFLWFADLVKMSERIGVRFEGKGLYGEATYDGKEGVLLFTNNEKKEKTILLEGVREIKKIRSISKKMRVIEEKDGKIILSVPAFDVGEIFFD